MYVAVLGSFITNTCIWMDSRVDDNIEKVAETMLKNRVDISISLVDRLKHFGYLLFFFFWY